MVDRGEFFAFLQRLDDFYRGPLGLNRPYGLAFVDPPRADLEGIAAWGFDVYLNARQRGVDRESAWMQVASQIQGTEEYQRAHPPTHTGPGVQSFPRENGLLTVQGGKIMDEQGARWSQRGFTDFCLFARYLLGENTERYLQERADLGFNLVRVLGMMRNLRDFDPSQYPRYMDKLGPFADLVASYGLRLEFVVFADAQLLMPDLTLQQAWFELACNQLRGKWNVQVELVNEAFKNGVDPQRFSQPAQLLSSRGSNGADMLPPTPPWDYLTYHPARTSDWPRKMHNAMADCELPFGAPATCDEIMGASEVSVPGSRDSDPDNFFDAAALARLLVSGSTFHSEAGLRSNLLPVVQLTCAEAYIEGCAAVPLDYREGTYTRGGLGDCPIAHFDSQASRTYARILGNRALAVVVQRNASWVLEPVHGWRVVNQVRGVIELERD